MILLGSALEKPFTSVPNYYESYGVVLAVAVAGVALVAVAFGAARLIAPHRPLPAKLTTYECGIDPVGEGWSQSQVRYYIYGFLFVIFDVESVFLFPWARVFESLGLHGGRRDGRSSSASWRSACSTPGARGCSSGPDHRADPDRPGSSR